MTPTHPLTQTVGITLDRFILRQQDAFAYATGELSQLLRDLALAAKIVNRDVNRAGLVDLYGSLGGTNVQGEEPQTLDMVANVRFIRALTNGREVCAIVTEEDDELIHTGCNDGRYVVALDPLDGSSNIDVNVSIGTIFSVYRRQSPVGTPATADDFLQGGRKQVAAGYILYGTSTLLVYTTGRGVYGFTLENSLGEFILSHNEVKTPDAGQIYSVNEGNVEQFTPGIRQYISWCRQRRYMARYIGSLVADVHRNLLKGGIYLYPSTATHPQGKLRLLYECYPLAWLVEQAGGAASDGEQPILDRPITRFHERSPLLIGAQSMVGEAVRLVTRQETVEA